MAELLLGQGKTFVFQKFKIFCLVQSFIVPVRRDFGNKYNKNVILTGSRESSQNKKCNCHI